jgi:hypothetical protein
MIVIGISFVLTAPKVNAADDWFIAVLWQRRDLDVVESRCCHFWKLPVERPRSFVRLRA